MLKRERFCFAFFPGHYIILWFALFFTGEIFHLYGIGTLGGAIVGARYLTYTYQMYYGLQNSNLTLYSEGNSTKVKSYLNNCLVFLCFQFQIFFSQCLLSHRWNKCIK